MTVTLTQRPSGYKWQHCGKWHGMRSSAELSIGALKRFATLELTAFCKKHKLPQPKRIRWQQ